MTVCLDTNVFLQIFGRRQPFHPILRALLSGQISLAVSNEILLEYEEVTTRLSGSERWRNVALLLDNLSALHGNIRFAEPQFRFRVISEDADDNKFCDCAIAANADFIVTEDGHFNVLKSAGYKSQPIRPADFIQQL
jgi:putative PIN family toxin of toxin-antitoxin system